MALRLFQKRGFWALATALVVIFLFFQFRSDPGSGPNPSSARDPRHWTRGPLRDIANSTFGFEKIFVVGLPSRSDRRDGMVLQAALSDMQFEFIDGVMGKDVPDKAVPSSPEHTRLADASIGSWRAHMNAVREIVHRNLTTALILEDDVDWDVRIRDQLHDFALSTHALTQPLRSSPGGRTPPTYADETYPQPRDNSPESLPDWDFHSLPSTTPPTASPYGDNWDILWVGHCGMHFPFKRSRTVPKARIIRRDDETVAPRKNLWTLNIPFTLKENYPDHTRAYHHVQEGVCTLGYALTQRGARRLLHEVGLKDVSTAYDLLLRYFCEGEKGRKAGRQCLTTQPSLFHHHRMIGPMNIMSDIGDHGDAFRETAMTDMVRWSVRLNADVLMDGRTDFVNQYPDDVPGDAEQGV
ncbi:glycosyltransferase [Dichotomopilus funicola]|uniref:Glycosyltransferase n=1 Tax=Dichotomopilus funicola TaxID=1934379 RepID=A0AAN6ZIW2_9PEZI|nr:glycosyltransferase [Dichotomopilus funicola]